MQTMKKQTASRRLHDAKRMLRVYRKQLFDRHKANPLHSPPSFLLDLATRVIETTAKQLGRKSA